MLAAVQSLAAIQSLAAEAPTSAAVLSARRPDALAAAPLQADPTGRGLFAAFVTFLLASVFYAVTLHLAATFFVGDVPSQRAATVGPIPAAVSILLGRYGVEGAGLVSPEAGVVIVIAATLVADALAISTVYRLSWKPTAALTALHFAFAAVLGVALNNIFGLV